MAAGVDGFSNGPVNGWFYQAMTVDGVPGFLFRTYYQIGNGSTQNILVQ